MSEALLIDQLEVAALCNISTRSIRRWVAAKSFPKPVRLGARRLWRRSDIEAFVAAGSISAWRRSREK